ncbi:hypothetical protein UM93_00465 [Psychromicrobium lacuslunae]|uniref:Uncharacterized protein n=2 Tax=Psychromicrobium lacuslunae TaxID=1618207 RepID=A0A0D4C2X3_9MICC|nr:hypothetical protein [Psychromicrobium lacuslunae]AJT42745.1 hypothetical protein UM93_00465 [Psychromicrobium lacuslunae]
MFFNTVPLASPTPSPTPSLKDGLTTDQVSPGFLGFLATFFIVVIMVFLIVDMVRRIRRVRYRAQVAGELAAPVIPEAHPATDGETVESGQSTAEGSPAEAPEESANGKSSPK